MELAQFFGWNVKRWNPVSMQHYKYIINHSYSPYNNTTYKNFIILII